MDSSQASEEIVEKVEGKHEDKNVDMNKLQAMVTPEQVLSATVARRRRTLSKKQGNRAREQTPCRETKQEATSDEEVIEQRPKTPERRRKKSKASINSLDRSEFVKKDQQENYNAENVSTSEVTNHNTLETKKIFSNNGDINVKSNKDHEDNFSNGFTSPEIETKHTEQPRKESLINITQAEVISLFNKAKRSLTSGRDRARHRNVDKSAAIRSQSVPYEFTEELLYEGLRKAKLLEDDSLQEIKPIQKQSEATELTKGARNYLSKCSKPQEGVRRRRRQYSAKVVEILDPKTSKVVKKINKGVIELEFKFFDFFKILKYLTIKDIINNYKSFKNEYCVECKLISKLRNRCISDVMIILIFCGLGGIMFKYVEGSFENYYKCGVKRVKRDFIDVLWHRSHNLREDEWKSLARNKLRSFEEELHVAHEAGMHSYSGQKSWSFLNGVVFCLTVITTIGYGHIYPKTVTGQALTVVYAIIGIPLFLIALTDFGKLFTRCIKFVWSFVRRVYYTGSCRRARKTAHMEDILHGAQVMYEIATLRRPSIFTGGVPEETVDVENPKPVESPKPLDSATIGTDEPTTPALSHFEIDDEFNLPISLAIILLILYIFTGAVMYCLLEEEWNFFSAFYFVFISMSTIGFGDYVPTNPICVIASIFYLVFGLALMSMCINVVQVKLSDTFKDASAKLGATMGLEVHADGSASPVDCTDAPEEEVPETPVPDESTNLTTTESKLERKSSLRVPKEGNEENVKTTKEVKF